MNIRRRWGGIVKSWPPTARDGVEVQVWLCDPENLRDLEQQKILKLRPKLNSKKYPGRYPDLRWIKYRLGKTWQQIKGTTRADWTKESDE